MFALPKKSQLISPSEALPGRETAISKPASHFVLNTPLTPPFPAHLNKIIFAMGCFWGAEKRFWQLPGVYCTAVGYCNGYTPNPSYEEVCTGMTAHAEAILVVFDPAEMTLQQLLIQFWEGHNPTQGMRQEVDIGSQYRSGIFTDNEQQAQIAEASRQHYQQRLTDHGFDLITTEIAPAQTFYYAEDYHQQYLAKTPRLSSCDIPLQQTGRPAYCAP